MLKYKKYDLMRSKHELFYIFALFCCRIKNTSRVTFAQLCEEIGKKFSPICSPMYFNFILSK